MGEFVYRVKLGVGSCFTVELPLLPLPVKEEVLPEEVGELPSGTRLSAGRDSQSRGELFPTPGAFTFLDQFTHPLSPFLATLLATFMSNFLVKVMTMGFGGALSALPADSFVEVMAMGFGGAFTAFMTSLADGHIPCWLDFLHFRHDRSSSRTEGNLRG